MERATFQLDKIHSLQVGAQVYSLLLLHLNEDMYRFVIYFLGLDNQEHILQTYNIFSEDVIRALIELGEHYPEIELLYSFHHNTIPAHLQFTDDVPTDLSEYISETMKSNTITRSHLMLRIDEIH